MSDTLLFLLGSVCYQINHFRHFQVPVMISFYQDTLLFLLDPFVIKHIMQETLLFLLGYVCYQINQTRHATVPVWISLLSSKACQTCHSSL